MSEVIEKARAAKETTTTLAGLSTEAKNNALAAMAQGLTKHAKQIITANEEDLARGREQGISSALLDRLKLTEDRIAGIAESIRQIIELPDPIGDKLDSFTRPNGMHIEKVRVPLGVIGIIYEARPNVTVDAAALCLKTGNAVVLRGGSSAISSNLAIIRVLKQALADAGLPPDALQLIEDTSRASASELLKLNGLIDVIIPRGGASLIQHVVQNATVPVIETGAGICHTYLDDSADPAMAEVIALNAKLQRPSVCNAMETLLVHESFAASHLANLAAAIRKAGAELRGCEKSLAIAPEMATLATEQDYATEYNDYVLNVKVVANLDEALAHIRRFGTMHSECIVTSTQEHADRFLQEVDAAAVFHNVSTRFTDGFEFGFGAEIGISTQKLHVRGPMGLPALTSTKFRITGNGQIRS